MAQSGCHRERGLGTGGQWNLPLEVRDPGRTGRVGLGSDVARFNSRLGNPSPRLLLSDAALLPTTEPMPPNHTPRWGGVLEGGASGFRILWDPGRSGTKALERGGSALVMGSDGWGRVSERCRLELVGGTPLPTARLRRAHDG